MSEGNQGINIALYGGAFDPPHIGHTAFCRQLCSQSEFQQVWILPSYKHPFDKQLTNYEKRIVMCEIAFARLSPKVVISHEEILVPGQGYTLDLLRHLKKTYPQHTFTLALGTDNYQSRHRWKGFEEIKSLVQVKFYGRKGNEAENDSLGVDAPFPEVSSSQLRELLRKGERPTHLLPEGVMEFIVAMNLYS